MSEVLKPIITTAGLKAAGGTDGGKLNITFTKMALGDAGWSPDESATALRHKRSLISVNGERIGNNAQIHITGTEESNEGYWVKEIGFYIDNGSPGSDDDDILFAIWSSESRFLAYKSAGVDLLLSLDLVLSGQSLESVNFEDSGGFHLPAATYVKEGVMRFATAAETSAGTEKMLAIDPAQLVASMNSMGLFTHRAYFNTPGTSTFTVPAGVSRARITVAGGGGGGGGTYISARAGKGGDSEFMHITASGGQGGMDGDTNGAVVGANHGQTTGGQINSTGGGSAGGSPASHRLSGGAIFDIGQIGGNGGLAISDIADLAPGTIIPVTVGAGGAGGGRPGAARSVHGNPGADGYVIVEY